MKIPHAVDRTGIAVLLAGGTAHFAPALLVSATALFVLPQQAGGFRLAKWGVVGIALAVLAVALLVRRPRLPAPRCWLAVGGFVAAAVTLPALSSFCSRAEPLASTALSPTHWPTALGMLSGLALWLATSVALADGDASRRANLIVLTATGAFSAVLVLLQAAGLRWLTSDVYTGAEFRAPGTFGNPGWAAAFLAPLVPLSLGLGATAPRRWPHYATAALLGLATVATLSKGGALTLAAGVLAFVMLDRKVPGRWRIALLAVASASAAGALAVAWREDLFVTAPWLRGRIFLWRSALLLADEHPLTGLGLGGYVPAYGRSAATLLDGDPTAFVPLSSVDFAHNDVLQYAAEGGFVTAAAFVLVVVLALACAHRRGDPLARAVGAAVAAIFVNGLADSPMRVPSTFVLFFFLLGWLTATSGRARASARARREDRRRARRVDRGGDAALQLR